MDILSQAIEQAKQLYDLKVGSGDLTTENLSPYARHTIAEIIANNDSIVCGINILEALLKREDPTVQFHSEFSDGQQISSGDVVARIEGNGRAIITGWQVGQSILTLLSNICSYVKKASVELQPTMLEVTHSNSMPVGYDKLIRYAVSSGGGFTYATGLDESVYLTHDHTTWVSSMESAIDLTIQEVGENRSIILIIVEITEPEQVTSIEGSKVNYVYCRGFSADDIRRVGQLTKGWTKLIVDETISLEEVKSLRDTGVRLYQLDMNKFFQVNDLFSIKYGQ